MKSFLLSLCFLAVFSTTLFAEDDVLGFWKTIDDTTGKAQSIVAIYKYQDKYFGRLILTYNDNGSVNDTIYSPKERAPGVEGNPYYVGMDIIWNLVKNGDKCSGGSIIDPEKGYVYGAQLWRKGSDLIARGELLFIGKNQTWPPAQDSDFPPGFKKPDTSTFVPVIPVVKSL